jgi:ubiquinol-cytochrome c reductase cytochrome c1 subunit
MVPWDNLTRCSFSADSRFTARFAPAVMRCHSLPIATLRSNEEEIKAIAASATVKDGPNDAGEMFDRPGMPSDRFVPPFPNEQAARAANNGAYPPDLSLMVKARADGANYVRALLKGYAEPPAGVKVPDGMHYNKYFAGHFIAMPPILTEGGVQYADNTKASIAQQSEDVTAFLAWTAEPMLQERKQTGLRVILFLLVMTTFFYLAKRQIWSRIKKKI